MLAVAGRLGPFASGCIVGAKQMQEVGLPKARGPIRQPPLVNQKRKRDSGLVAENAGVVAVAQTYGRQVGPLGFEFLFMCAQLRDVLAAEQSSIVAEENYDSGLAFPKRPEPYFAAIHIGQRNTGECFA